MTQQRDLWPETVSCVPEKAEAQPAPTPPPSPQPVVKVAPVRRTADDIHDPFSGISIDIAPLAKVVGNKDPFAQALLDAESTDEAKVTEDVYDREHGQEIE